MVYEISCCLFWIFKCSNTFTGVAVANPAKGFKGSKSEHLNTSIWLSLWSQKTQVVRYKGLFKNVVSFKTLGHVQPVPVSERTNSPVPCSVIDKAVFQNTDNTGHCLLTSEISIPTLVWILAQHRCWAHLGSSMKGRAENWQGRCYTLHCLQAWGSADSSIRKYPALQQSELTQQKWLKSSFVPPSQVYWAEESPTPGSSCVSLKEFLSQLANKTC